MFSIPSDQNFVCNDETLIDILIGITYNNNFETKGKLKEFIERNFDELFCYGSMPYFYQLFEWLNNCRTSIDYCNEVLEGEQKDCVTDMWRLLTIASNEYVRERVEYLLDKILA